MNRPPSIDAVQSVAIIDLGSGNLRSVEKATQRAATDAGINANIFVTSNSKDIDHADRIILPGVGAFAACMDGLNGLENMRQRLEHAVFTRKTPILGICVGMQIMATKGLEYGETNGLDWISGTVSPIARNNPDYKVPHMGWNKVIALKEHDLFGQQNEISGIEYYFLHSFHFVSEMEAEVTAISQYNSPITACISRDNIIGVQFHPEKSQKAGLKLLENFLNWQPVFKNDTDKPNQAGENI